MWNLEKGPTSRQANKNAELIDIEDRLGVTRGGPNG